MLMIETALTLMKVGVIEADVLRY